MRHDPRRLTPWLLASLLALLPAVALAQQTPAPATDAPHGMVEASVGVGQVDEDLFILLGLSATLRYHALAAALQVPLRLRVFDDAPSDASTLRAEDWDTTSDRLRVIRYVAWGEPGDWLHARVGELAGVSLGHATIVRNYLNVIDVDRFQLGLTAELNILQGGVELLLDNLIAPEVIGARAHVRPWGFIDPSSLAAAWSIGLSVVSDLGAPLALRVDPATGAPAFNDAGDLEVARDALTLLGLDTDLVVYDSDLLRLMPYADVNLTLGAETGAGLHAGLLTSLRLDAAPDLDLRLEYQRLGPHYLPHHVDALYELQRLVHPAPDAYAGGETPRTRQAVAAATNTARHGWLVQLSTRVLDLFRLSLLYQDAEGPDDATAIFQLQVPFLDRLQLGAVYIRSGASGADLFDASDALIRTFLQVNVWSLINVQLRYGRAWRLRGRPGDPERGRYDTVHDWSAGVSAGFEY